MFTVSVLTSLNSSSSGKNTLAKITTISLLILYFFKVALSTFRLTVRMSMCSVKGSSSVVVTRFQRSYPHLPSTMETTIWKDKTCAHNCWGHLFDLSKRNLLG
ncbi:hypothetical protein MOSE0_N16270 [Monosporozyma servazzii]